MADRKVPASTPVLRGPGDIYNAFKGLVLFKADDLRTKGVAIVSWSISGINAEARAHGVTFDQVKDALRPKLFKALRALPGVTVEIIDSRDQAAKLTLLPGAAGRNNGTRKAARSPPKGEASAAASSSASAAAATRRSNRSPSRSPPKAAAAAVAAKNSPKVASNSATAAAVAHVAPSATLPAAEAKEAVAEAVSAAVGGAGARPSRPKTAAQLTAGLLNKLQPDMKNAESIRTQLLMLAPASEEDYTKMIKVVHDRVLLDSKVHPFLIDLLRHMTVHHTTHPYPSPPCAALNACLLSTCAKGNEGAHQLAELDEKKKAPNMKQRLNESANNHLERTFHLRDQEKDARGLGDRYDALMLFMGFLMREEMLRLADFERVFRALKVKEEDHPLIQDSMVKDMMFLLARAGPRLSVMPEAGELFRAAVHTTREIAAAYPRAEFKFLARELIECMERGWVSKESDKWAKGAPPDMVIAKPIAKALAPEGLGPDPLELARRFPLVVKLDAIAKGVHAVEIHGKKMRERCAASGKSEKEVLAAVFELVKNSAHFVRAADPAGAPAGFLMAIRKGG